MIFPHEEISWLVGQIGKIEYGCSRRFDRHEWRRAIPRIDPASQVMLIASGHRPGTERDPIDWVRFWINGTKDDSVAVKHWPFVVREDPHTGDLLVSLPECACPRCGGGGRRPKMTPSPLEFESCDHAKLSRDRTNVSWP